MGNACIIRVNGNKFFGTVTKYSADRKAYLVEIRKSKLTQWVKESLVETRTHLEGVVK